MNTVPFTLEEVYSGFANCHGLIRDEGEHLVLEFQIQDSLVGLIKSGVKQVRIPLAELASVALERKWFGMSTNIVIQLSHMQPVQDVPGMKQGRLVLAIARKDREAAAKFVADLHVAEER
ncbi:MAG TPA: hypothetical protein VKS79_26630 [Gemmataceae bacterium]|nr:hypothetical protein [Gemmataceae bacterium]